MARRESGSAASPPLHSGAAAAVLALLAAACASPAPPPPPAARPAPAPAPAPAAPSVYQGDWADWPLTDGDWSYAAQAQGQSGGSIARYGTGRAPAFAVRCDPSVGRIELAHPGVLEGGRSAAMTVRATAGSARYPVANSPGQPGYVVATLDPRDPQLDRMVYSRGRFVVEIEGASEPLVLPSWPEVARVIEDCR